MAKRTRFHAPKPKKIQQKSLPRYSHLYQKITENNSKIYSDTLFLWGKVRNTTFHNPFFTFSITNLLQTSFDPQIVSIDPKNDTKIHSTYEFIVQLSKKTPSLPSIKKESQLIFSENKQIYRYNMITKEKIIYKPQLGELGEIITNKSMIANILGQQGEYVRIKRITLDAHLVHELTYHDQDSQSTTYDEKRSTLDPHQVQGKSFSSTNKSVQSYTKETKEHQCFTDNNPTYAKKTYTHVIKALQLVVDGWFKGYIELGTPLKGIFDFSVQEKTEIAQRELHHNKKSDHKLYKYKLKYLSIESILRTTQDIARNSTVRAKIVDFIDGNYIVEPVNTVCMSVGW